MDYVQHREVSPSPDAVRQKACAKTKFVIQANCDFALVLSVLALSPSVTQGKTRTAASKIVL